MADEAVVWRLRSGGDYAHGGTLKVSNPKKSREASVYFGEYGDGIRIQMRVV